MSSTPSLTLYYFNGACSLAVRILLHELDLPFESVKMALDSQYRVHAADGSLSAEEYKAQIHHMGLVPALSLKFPGDGTETATTLTEMPSILTYLISLAPEKKSASLVGSTQLDRSKTLAWLVWLSGTLHGQGYGPFFVPGRWIAGEEGADRVKEAGRNKVESCYESIERRLPEFGKDGRGDDEVTVVELNAYVFWRWGANYGFEMSKYPRYGEIAKKVEGRESVRKALEEEELKGLFV
ncbi:putative glutathione S-transferase [Cladorrhinum sp. PSN332]|nr:putative glutathione S-transferase [Cladorrhinum sp. PSN332]